MRSPFFPLALPLSGHAFSTTFPVNHLLPPDHKETQPFHPAVQRSADSSSNPRGPTQPHPNPTSQAATLTYRSNPTFRAATLTYRPNPISRAATLTYRPEKPAREACAACRRGFVGGWLLGCRESAKSVFQKSELASLRQRTFEKQRRFPPAKNQLPSCRVRRQAAHASRAYFSRSPPSHKKRTATDLKSTTVLHKHHPISISPSAQQSSLSIPAHSSADPPPS